MIAGNAEEIALVITGRDQGAAAAARGVGNALREASTAATAATEKVALSANDAAAALKGLGIAAKADAAGNISVASKDVEAATNIVRGLGATAVVTSAEMKAAGTAAVESSELTVAAAERAAVAQNVSAGAAETVAKSTGKIPSQARSAANGLVAMSFALTNANGSMQSAAIAGGLVASSLATMTDNAKIAGAANGIGAVVTVLGLLAAEYEKVSSEQGKVSAGFQQRLGFSEFTDNGGHFDQKVFDQLAKEIAARRDAALAKFDTAGSGGVLDFFKQALFSSDTRAAFDDVNNANAELAALSAKRVEGLVHESKLQDDLARKRRQEREDATYAVAQTLRQGEAEAQIVRLRAEGSNQLDLARQADDNALEAAKARIEAQFRLRDEYGNLRELTAGEVADQQRLIAQAERLNDLREVERERSAAEAERASARQTASAVASTASEKFTARMAEIDAETEAQRRAGLSEEALEASKQAKIRALRKQTRDAALADAGTLTGTLIASGNAELKAIGHFGESIRRVVIGAEAARAGVRSAVEGAEAIASLAVGDLKGAALHGASSLQLAAAAALGFKESLGGGGGNGGGGGSGGGTGADSFTPRNQSGAGGGVTLIVQTVDPTSRAVVNNLRYQFARADTLNVPVPITGGGAVHVLAGAG